MERLLHRAKIRLYVVLCEFFPGPKFLVLKLQIPKFLEVSMAPKFLVLKFQVPKPLVPKLNFGTRELKKLNFQGNQGTRELEDVVGFNVFSVATNTK